MTTFADKPTLRGQRVLLRPIIADDADSMQRDLEDEEALRLTGTHATFDPDQIRAWASSRAAQLDRLDLAVVDLASGAWAGEVVINDVDPQNRSCGFRIALSAGARDRGLGTEATRMVLDHVFDTIDDPRIHRVELEVYEFNPRAIAVYERVGFRREGVRRDALQWQGEFHDAILMSMLRSDRER